VAAQEYGESMQTYQNLGADINYLEVHW